MQSNFRVAGWDEAAIGSSQVPPFDRLRAGFRAKDARNGGNHFNIRVNFNIKGNIKINGKGNGQECPFHTGVAALR